MSRDLDSDSHSIKNTSISSSHSSMNSIFSQYALPIMTTDLERAATPLSPTSPPLSPFSTRPPAALGATKTSPLDAATTATTTTSKPALAALPDALLLQIFELIGIASKSSLCSVSRLSKHYHTLADSVLYKRVHFDTPELHLVFSESLPRRPRRGSAIYDISLAYPSSELEKIAHPPEDGNYTAPPLRVDGLSRTIQAMSNLESLNIAVPESLLPGIGSLFNGPFDLACLKSCELFYQCKDDAYWDLQENIHIFSHPSLETLIIRRAKLDYRGFQIVERPEQTALQKLHFIECDINDDALADVLEFPEGLKEFVMTQTPEPVPEIEEMSDDCHDYIVALSAQAATLESIIIDVPTLGGRKTLRMRDFKQLKTLRLGYDYHLFGKTSKKQRLTSIGLPPNMETLELFGELGSDEGVTDLMISMLQIGTILANHWKQFIVVADDDGKVPQVIIDACKQGEVPLEIIGHAEPDDEPEDTVDEPEEIVDEPEEIVDEPAEMSEND